MPSKQNISKRQKKLVQTNKRSTPSCSQKPKYKPTPEIPNSLQTLCSKITPNQHQPTSIYTATAVAAGVATVSSVVGVGVAVVAATAAVAVAFTPGSASSSSSSPAISTNVMVSPASPSTLRLTASMVSLRRETGGCCGGVGTWTSWASTFAFPFPWRAATVVRQGSAEDAGRGTYQQEHPSEHTSS